VQKTGSFRIILPLILLVSVFNSSDGQTLENYIANLQKIYGSDAELVNGEKYYYPYSAEAGDPFLNRREQKATIWIMDRKFEDQTLHYDIYNQFLVLEYEDLYGGRNSLVLRKEWVGSFTLGDRFFRKLNGPEGGMEYFQEICDDSISCYYYWKKDYLLTLTSGVQSYYFTEPIREAYLLINGRFYSFRNNRSFTAIFGKDIRRSVKDYFRQNHIKIKKVSDREMHDLVKYCNTLTDETG